MNFKRGRGRTDSVLKLRERKSMQKCFTLGPNPIIKPQRAITKLSLSLKRA